MTMRWIARVPPPDLDPEEKNVCFPWTQFARTGPLNFNEPEPVPEWRTYGLPGDEKK